MHSSVACLLFMMQVRSIVRGEAHDTDLSHPKFGGVDGPLEWKRAAHSLAYKTIVERPKLHVGTGTGSHHFDADYVVRPFFSSCIEPQEYGL